MPLQNAASTPQLNNSSMTTNDWTLQTVMCGYPKYPNIGTMALLSASGPSTPNIMRRKIASSTTSFSLPWFTFKLSVSTCPKCPESSHCSFSYIHFTKCLLYINGLGQTKNCWKPGVSTMFPPVFSPLGPEATGWWCGKDCEFRAWIPSWIVVFGLSFWDVLSTLWWTNITMENHHF